MYRDFPRDAPRAIGALESKLARWAKKAPEGALEFWLTRDNGLSLKVMLI